MATVNSNTIHVSNAAELNTALANASGGDTILMAAGNYGDIVISRAVFSDTVTVKSLDADNPAVINEIKVLNSNNLTFDSIDFDFIPDMQTHRGDQAVYLYNSNNITVKNSTIEGGPAVNGVPPETEAGPGALDETGNVLGRPAGIGFFAQNGENIALENSDISGFDRGVLLSNIDGTQILDSAIHDVRRSPIGGANLDNVVIDGNHLYNSFPWQPSGPGDHGDMIHIWTDAGHQDGPSKNYQITNNFMEQGDGFPILGIYLDDDLNYRGYENVVIANNVINNGNEQGIRIERGNGVEIQHNTLLYTGDERGHVPGVGVILYSNTINTTVSDNILSFIDNRDGNTSNVFHDNLVPQRDDPDAPNYYADLFIDAMDARPSLADLQFIPGTDAAQSGVGAAQTQYQPTQDWTARAHNHVDADSEFGFRFDASYSSHDGHRALAGDAQYHWDFGDGTQASGLQVNHSYATHGEYPVTLTITEPSGQVHQAVTTARIADPVLLDITFDQGVVDDVSSYDTQFWNRGQDHNIVQHAGRSAYHLTPSTAFDTQLSESKQIFGLDQFTFSFDLARASSTDGTGRLFGVHVSWILDMAADGSLVFKYTDQEGKEYTIKSTGTITDTQWHDVALKFDADAGALRFEIDGADAGGGAIGAGLKKMQDWALSVGNLWGTNFEGYLDEVKWEKPGPNNTPDTSVDPDGNVPVSNIEPLLMFDLNDAATATDSLLLKGDTHLAGNAGAQHLVFDGQSDYVSLGIIDTDARQSGALSIALDFQRADTTDSGYATLYNSHGKHSIYIKNDTIFVNANLESGMKQFSTKADIGDTDWHQIGLVIDQNAGVLEIVLDGEVILHEEGLALDAIGDSPWQSWAPTIGGTAWASNNSFNGNIDNLALVDEALQPQEVLSLSDRFSGAGNVTSEPQEPEIDPLLMFDFNEPNTAADTLVLKGDTHVANGGHLVFDGQSDYASLGIIDTDARQTGELSISFDFQRADVADGRMEMLYNSLGKHGIFLRGDTIFVNAGLESGMKQFSAKADIGDTDWHQIGLAIDQNAGVLELVLDGEVILHEEGLALDAIGDSPWQSWAPTIGGTAWASNTSFNGNIDNFALVDEALQSQEFLSLSDHLI